MKNPNAPAVIWLLDEESLTSEPPMARSPVGVSRIEAVTRAHSENLPQA
jgi:hypothetical protein